MSNNGFGECDGASVGRCRLTSTPLLSAHLLQPLAEAGEDAPS
jgi:hypothetical protein